MPTVKWWQWQGKAQQQATAGCYEQIVLPHLDSAYSMALWLTRDAVLAQDVVQDAALRALRYFPSFHGGDPRAWFLQIVRNAAHTALEGRMQNHAELLDVDARADPSDDPEAALARRQVHDGLVRTMAALPLELRECLVLRALEELSYKQIAEVTGAPIGTVMSRLWRARQLLMTREGELK